MEKRTYGSLFVVLLSLSAACGDEEKSAGGSSCEAICQRIEAADCRRAAPDCLAQCKEDHDVTPEGCLDQLGALSRCFGNTTFQCDASGYPEANGCARELDAWLACRDAEDEAPQDEPEPNDPAPEDEGPVGSDFPLTCDLPASADACDQCVAGACCDEIEACGADCQALFSCIDTCTNDLCFEACVKTHPRGTTALTELSDCFASQCEQACGDTGEGPSDGDDLSESCLPTSVPDGYCDGTGKPVGHDCPLAKPYADCVLSPTGAANVYCCNQ